MVIILFVEGESNMKSSKQEKCLKKGLVLILYLVLLCTTVFACGKDKESNTEEEKEVVSDITGEDSGEGSAVDDEVQSDETQNDSEDVSDDTAQGNDEPVQDEDTAQGNDEPTQGEDESIQGDDEPIEDIPSQDEELVAEFPRMDGSTSAIPLEAGLRSELYDISYYEAYEQVSHTTTHQSFDRLITGEVDLIFTVPISQEQQDKANANGIELVMEPVAKEGFVFVVNAANPVDSLTQDQIRKIYSGEITNWKEVGGVDAPILAYQRNEDSGSQNYMTEFMGDVQLMEPVTTTIPGGMAAMMDAVASYNNAENAIGYSVYSYAAQMYANQNEIKFIEIDGIKPSKATMADGTYPLLSCTYVMYKSNHSRSDELAELVERMTSEEGQKAVLACGYIPVMDMEIPDNYLPYEAVGTGIERPIDYVPSRNFTYPSGLFEMCDMEYEPATFKTVEEPLVKPINKITGFTIKFLEDVKLQDEINNKIKEMFLNMEQYTLEHPEMIFYTPDYSTFYGYDKYISMSVKNGYLSILIGYPINLNELGYEDFYGHYSFGFYQYCETLCYDLIEGKQIEEFSDLFYQDEEFVPIINNALTNNMALFCSDNEKMVELLGVDFSGLLGEEQDKFTLSSIYFNEDNPYFQIPVLYSFEDESMMDNCIIYQYRNMDGIFVDELSDTLREGQYEEYEFYIEKIGENSYKSVLGSRFHTIEGVNDKRNAYIHVQDEYRRIFDMNNHSWFYVYEYDDCYKVVLFFESPYEEPILYVHKEALQPFTIDDFLKDGWKEYLIETYADKAEFLSKNDYDSEAVMLIPNWSEPDYTIIHFYYGDSSTRDWNDFYSFNIPNEYLKREI